MNFSETFDELSLLTEGPGGQRTHKDFLLFLAEFLGIKMPTNYKTNWVLHHRDCNRFNNSEFENLVLMNPVHHISLHVQLRIKTYGIFSRLAQRKTVINLSIG